MITQSGRRDRDRQSGHAVTRTDPGGKGAQAQGRETDIGERARGRRLRLADHQRRRALLAWTRKCACTTRWVVGCLWWTASDIIP